MAQKIQLRRDTAANWVSFNPVLSVGEIGVELGTKKFKIGDGTTPWNALSYEGNSPHVHSPNDVTGTAVVTNDSRLSDARTPLSHAHAPTDVTGTAVITSDSRLSDARTPLAHTHTGVYEPANANIQTHVVSAHAPANAQKNSDILQAEIEAKLTGVISTHSHSGSGTPASTVVSETTVGQSSAVGTSLNYAREDHTHGTPSSGGGGLGYTINVQALTSSPADGATVYFGMLPKAPSTTANISKVHIRKAGTLKMANIYCYSGTAGTGEAWSLNIRVNNTTDYLIQTLSVAASERIFTNSALSISLVAGDSFEIKGVQPTWATNPLTTIYGGYVYIE